MRRKKTEGSDASAGGRVTPADVQQAEFRLAFRGYNERDVDAFLDRITEDLSTYIEENQRLRAGASSSQQGAPDLAAAQADAQRIVAEARQEAARIVREAESRAAVLATSGGADPRAAVTPFLSSEREFLQSLGALVQGHAEEVKRMVAEMRSAAVATSTGTGAASAPSQAEPMAETESEAVADVATGAEPEPQAPTTAEEAFAPISVPAAEDAGSEADEPLPEPAPARLRTDSGDRSLRELFWGED
ncbi:MAG TPA: DivIVA domain-containing protein [Actinomycetota bacterium]|nr:DivIVA domain-containing protein [Actinomycetota bacterium]